MGVPGFFLWLWKRYKGSNFVFSKASINNEKYCDNELLNKINSIDEFLLDLNCAIHPMCFKVLADNPELNNLERLENKMMNQVIEYIDELLLLKGKYYLDLLIMLKRLNQHLIHKLHIYGFHLLLIFVYLLYIATIYVLLQKAYY